VNERQRVNHGYITGGISVGPIGVPVRRRYVVTTTSVLLALAALAFIALVTGTLHYPISRIVTVLAGDGSRIENLVIVDRRLVRIAAAIAVGFMLGMSGALTQSITRNPIASPDILGVTTGASAVAVFFVTNPGTAIGPSDASATSILTPATLIGGIATTSLILALAWRGGFDGLRLVLVGLGINAIAVAAITWMMTRATTTDASIAARWLTGSVDGVKSGDLLLLGPIAALGLIASVTLGRSVSTLQLGRDVATSLGTPAGRTELAALAVAVLLASAATAVAGPVAFVAFVAPQAALRLFRTAGPTPFAAGLVGAVMLAASDLVAQHLLFPLPAGVVTSVVGAPCLLLLIVTQFRSSSV